MKQGDTPHSIDRVLRRWCYALLAFEALLGVAHVLWPEYRWGQGRRSYFNLGNSLTLASWLLSMQFVAVAGLALVAFHRERAHREDWSHPSTWMWLASALAALGLSFAEMSRLHIRLELLGWPDPDVFERLVIPNLQILTLVVFGWFVLGRVGTTHATPRGYVWAWLTSWGLALMIAPTSPLQASLLDQANWMLPARALAYLMGCTFLLAAVGWCATREQRSLSVTPQEREETDTSRSRAWMVLGVGGTAFTLILLQVLLFRMLTIFGDYLTSHSVVSIALLGIAVGGLIGYHAGRGAWRAALSGASMLLPFSVIAALGVSVVLREKPLVASLFLAVPFVCGSTVITVALVRAASHVVYFVDLVGAAMGALLAGPALAALREEGAFFGLAAVSFLVALCFHVLHDDRRLRWGLPALCLTLSTFWGAVACLNSSEGAYNIAYPKIREKWPAAQVLFSRSNLVGRYDIVRREPDYVTLSAYENGNITDTVRNRPTEQHQIDPRVPHTLREDPSILILGLSGDGITKTAKAIGGEVHGVEINPAVVALQTGELARLNAHSYEGIKVFVTDARSYVQQCDRKYDMITLLNTHLSRGNTAGRAPSPEYLYTHEAIESYLTRLTDRGVLIFEEPMSRPRREVPVWKLLVTLRQVLLHRGAERPEEHFFLFQWRTRRNNYLQILMKASPFTEDESARLLQWTRDVDNLQRIEAQAGRRRGPIHCKTTVLHLPHERLGTNYSRLVSGEAPGDLLRLCNLAPTTDNRPFHFDVDPTHSGLRSAYRRTLILVLLLVPLLALSFERRGRELHSAVPTVALVALTGIGYLLVEVVLMQRYQLFLASPSVSFAVVLGTLLLFSGLGSLWSGRLEQRSACVAVGLAVAALVSHIALSPTVFRLGAALSLPLRAALSVGMLAPLAFFLGVPFPYLMRTGKARFKDSAAATLFAVNGAGSALAVPLELNLSTSWGTDATLWIGAGLYVVVLLLLLPMASPVARRWTNGFALAALLALVATPWLERGAAPRHELEPDTYRVYGVSCGESRRLESQVIEGGDPKDKVSFEWLFWVIRGKGQTILVDTGFDSRILANRWRISDYVRPHVRLEQLGIAPVTVDQVILTHAHWDHMGDLGRYPNATVWLQKSEYNHLRSRVSPETPAAGGMRLKDLEELLKAERQGRLRLVDGQREVVPNVWVALGGAHTPGSQYVTVATPVGPVVIAGDLCNLYANNRRHLPVAGAHSPQENLRAIRAMQRRAASPFYLLPGHDPRVLKWFPEVSAGIAEIIPLDP